MWKTSFCWPGTCMNELKKHFNCSLVRKIPRIQLNTKDLKAQWQRELCHQSASRGRQWYYTFTRLVQHVVDLIVTRPSLSSSLDRHHLFIYFLCGAYQMKFPGSTWKLPKNVAGNLRLISWCDMLLSYMIRICYYYQENERKIFNYTI